MTVAHLLIAEDHDATRDELSEHLERRGFSICSARDGVDALEVFRSQPVDIVLSDHRMPRMDGLELHSELQLIRPVPFVLYSASASAEVTFRAGREGVIGFLNYPFDVETQLIPVLSDALRRAAEATANRSRHDHGELIGQSAALALVRREVDRYSNVGLNVLVTGETGTGKDLVARAIHDKSYRTGAAFVKVNCPALPETLVESELFGHERGAFTGAEAARRGRFEAANGGTIFLDEIGELPPNVQAKLLQVLQEARFERVGGTKTIDVDVRVVAATNRDLQAEVEAGRFREDLYYRVAQATIYIPALRERQEDIPLLARAFLDEACRNYRLPPPEVLPGFFEAIGVQPWKGNVRELKDMMERVVVWWDGDEPVDALDYFQAAVTSDSRLSAEDRALCHQMLQAYARNGRNQEAARREMNMSRAEWRHRWEQKFDLKILGKRSR